MGNVSEASRVFSKKEWIEVNLELEAEERQITGKGPAGRLRRQGYVPGVLYGKEVGSLPIKVKARELEGMLGRAGETTLIKVKVVPGEAEAKKAKPKEYTALIREIQRHPTKGVLSHVDLLQVSLREKIVVEVPVRLIGEPAGVKEGGILQHGLREVEIECLPADLPEHLEIDISALGIGDKVTVADLSAPDGVKILSDADSVLATVVAPRLVEAEEPLAEEAEGAEAAETEQE
ncbi:MAG: 50S ribosomal protein L25/general stress protein Ctc [Clostridia bacterium]|nr:50S ribosomal protein L25/general stress protein Ctc [Clostridia bacterium]